MTCRLKPGDPSDGTERDKDWPMIRRFVEAHCFSRFGDVDARCVGFWLGELRTASLLVEAYARRPEDAAEVEAPRPRSRSRRRGRVRGAAAEVEVEATRPRPRRAGRFSGQPSPRTSRTRDSRGPETLEAPRPAFAARRRASALDRAHWAPLRAELEAMRHARNRPLQ